ncbi:YkvA family protein [Streptomyces halstedii]|uniref:YkvA family protein n=1 Tax=Streptomyces halstedii TaxID=1944 RepID=UPI003804ED72
MDNTTVWLLLGALVALLMAGTAAVLLVRVLKARKLLLDAGVPLRDKALVWAAVIYTVSPVDLLPDPVYLDDIGFLLLALRSLHSAARAAGAGRRTAAGGKAARGTAAGGKAAPDKALGGTPESGGNLSASGSN